MIKYYLCHRNARRSNLLDAFDATDERIETELTRNETLGLRTKKRRYKRQVESSKVQRRNNLSKRNSRTKRTHIRRSMARVCCRECCMQNLSFSVIQDSRKWFHTDGTRSRTEGDKNIILSEIQATEYLKEYEGRCHKVYSIPSTKIVDVCAFAMKRILGTSNWKWNKVKNGNSDFLDESVSSSISRKNDKEELIYRYLQTLKELDAEQIPNEDFFDLPSNMLLCEIIRMFQCRDDVRDKNISKVYFMKIWQVHLLLSFSLLLLDQSLFVFSVITRTFAYLLTASFRNATLVSKLTQRKESFQMILKRVSLCLSANHDFCNQMQKLSLLTGKAMAVRVEHHMECRIERKFLWAKREECKQNPRKCVIIEIDGMDQRKTEIPRIADRPKSLDRCEVVKNHVVGVLINGLDFSIVTHFDHWKRGPNLTLSILFQTLKKLPKPWPLILYLQLDNCISENKNKTVFFFLALLVHMKVFDKVCLHSVLYDNMHHI